MKYEFKYTHCADLRCFDFFQDLGDCDFKIVNFDLAKEELINLMDSWHERGIMKPKVDKKLEK